MSIIELFAEVADVIRPPARQHGPVQRFETSANPRPDSPDFFTENPHLIEGMSGLFDTILATAGRIASIAGRYSTLPGTEAVVAAADIFAPALHNFPMGFRKIVHGIQTKNLEMIATGTESVLTLSTTAVAVGLRLEGIAPGKEMLPGISLVMSTTALIDGIHWLYHTYGTETAVKTLFAILQNSNPPDMPSSQTGLLQSGADLKLKYYRSLPPMLAAICWVGYKYNPDWLTKSRVIIGRIGLPALGLAAAIVGILTIAGTVASGGVAPLIMGGIGGGVALGFIFYRGIKYLQSKRIFMNEIFPKLKPEQKSDLDFCIQGAHAALGATIGDFYRYQIALLLYEVWRLGYLSHEKVPLNLISTRRMPVAPDPNVREFRDLAQGIRTIQEEFSTYNTALFAFIVDSLGVAVWHVIVHDIDKRKARKLLDRARQQFITGGDTQESRREVLRMFFSVLRVNR